MRYKLYCLAQRSGMDSVLVAYSMNELPGTYLKQPHPLIQIDRTCQHCELGQRMQRLNETKKKNEERHFMVGGAGPDDLSQVKLLVLSCHPGHYETQESNLYPMVDTSLTQQERKKGLLRPHNAGGFMRMALNLMFGLDTYNECWFTNAVKCNPFDVKLIESKHIKPCVSTWLVSEFSMLDEYCPKAPLLVAGAHAFRAVKMLYKNEAKWMSELGLNGCRRRGDLTLNGRPAVFTENSAKISRSEPRLESEIKKEKGRVIVTRNEWLYPPLPGSPVASFINDLRFLEDLL